MGNYDVSTLIGELRHALAQATDPHNSDGSGDTVVFEIAGCEFELCLFHDPNINNSPCYLIDGYWNDKSNEGFEGYRVCEFDNTPKGFADDDIFFYGLSREQARLSIGEINLSDFSITKVYEEG